MNAVLAHSQRDNGFPPPRDFQIKAHEALRQGFRDGHQHQVIMAATGAGKTYLGMRICYEAMQKNKRAVFLCDRTTLIEQTSTTADRYGLTNHGVVQANHWRRRPEEPLQIASVQTIAKRGFWPKLDVLVVDEVHAQYKAWVDYAKTTDAVIIGLSATPFSPGLGKIFTNLVNAATMHELTQSGVLVPMRIFSCHRPDMEGAEMSGGEWTDKAAEERELKIVGDVVKDWMKFGDNRKTIVFGATIKHCEELCRQFIDAGIMAAMFTSETTATERETLLEEYRKPDSYLKVLISVEALAKGFDCIAEGSRILTDRGYVAIEKVLNSDKLWDGHEFVSHGGIIYKGERDVITYTGITATKDHLVKTDRGWIPFGECKRLGLSIVCTELGGQAIREDDGYFASGNGEKNNERIIHKHHVPMFSLWIRNTVKGALSSSRIGMQKVLHGKRGASLVSRQNKVNEGSMWRSIAQSLSKLWWPWNRVPFRLSPGCCELDREEFGIEEAGQEHSTGSHQQQWSLRAGKFALGTQVTEYFKHTARWLGSKDTQVQDGTSGNQIRRQDIEKSILNGDDFGSNHKEIPHEIGQTKRRVWDILNAGSRNSFTCEGLLVHNCQDVGCVCDARPLRKSLSTAIQMWGRGLRSSPETGKKDCHLLDFSGNIVRFFEDFNEIYFNGLDKLDDGEKLDKTPRTKEEFEAKGCPRCGYSPYHKRCMACGYEKISKVMEEALPGHMQEIFIGTGKNKRKIADNSEHLWNQLATYARIHSSPANQSGRAWHLFKQITGTETQWQFSRAPNVEITQGVLNKIRQINMQWKKGAGR